jgi:glycosyltransferase involved in cell wall biosynthesis
VLPYKSATQSGITNISYHFNLPVVATDVGGLRETIRDGETGLIVDRPEAEAVSAGIRRFFEVREKVDFQRNIEALKKDLSWDAFADALTEFAERL